MTIQDECQIQINDVVSGSNERLEFRDAVVQAKIGFHHLVVATRTQCHIFSDRNWNTPIIIDLNNGGRVTCVQQCANYFILADITLGITIYSYEGRVISNPKYPGMRPELLTTQTVSVSTDIIAVKDYADEKCTV